MVQERDMLRQRDRVAVAFRIHLRRISPKTYANVPPMKDCDARILTQAAATRPGAAGAAATSAAAVQPRRGGAGL